MAGQHSRHYAHSQQCTHGAQDSIEQVKPTNLPSKKRCMPGGLLYTPQSTTLANKKERGVASNAAIA